jgi:hypothetical protein
LEGVEQGAHRWQEAGGFCPEQNAEQADGSKSKLHGDLAATLLIHKDGVGVNLSGKGEGSGLAGIEAQGGTQQRRQGSERLLTYAKRESQVCEPRTSRNEAGEFQGHLGRDNDVAKEQPEQIALADTAKVDKH